VAKATRFSGGVRAEAMTEAQIVAWIFYSVAGASGQGPADFNGISTVADGINHAVPTHKELQSSLSWLQRVALVTQLSRRYALTGEGEAVMNSARQKANTTMSVWKELTQQMERIAKSSNQPLNAIAPKDGAPH
jgi:hypothetical protein